MSWVDGFGTPTAESLAVDPFQPGTMLAIAASSPYSEGLFRSTNAGSSWQPHKNGLGGSDFDIGTIAYDPVTPGTVYLGYGGLGLSKSVDGGNAWTNTTPANFATSRALLIDPTAPATLYAGSHLGVSKSVDAGATWALANT